MSARKTHVQVENQEAFISASEIHVQGQNQFFYQWFHLISITEYKISPDFFHPAMITY